MVIIFNSVFLIVIEKGVIGWKDLVIPDINQLYEANGLEFNAFWK